MFRYEHMWRRDSSYTQMVETAWGRLDNPMNLSQLSSQLEAVTGTMKDWEQSSFGSMRQELNRLRRELESVRRSSLCSGPTRHERQLMARLSELLTREEVMEKQRSRIEWLREGDRNTSFFQVRSKERVRINRISALRRDDGSIATTQVALESTALEFYSKLFTR
jgi:hypothetical protein